MGFQETMKALGDPTRREILQLLRDGKLSVGDIVANFNITGASISHHLSVLKNADLIVFYKEKNFIYYELNASVFEELLMWLSQFKGEDSSEEK